MSKQKQKLDPRKALQALNALGDALEHLKNASKRFEESKDKEIEVQDETNEQKPKAN